MKNRITAFVLGGALAMVGLTPVPLVAEQARAGSPAKTGQKTPQEPVATPDEFKARVDPSDRSADGRAACLAPTPGWSPASSR